MGLQREQLHGLAQTHVVGQAAAQSERGQEGQPGQPALLVRAQRRAEPVRRFERLQRLRRGTAEQVAQPTVGAHRGQLERDVDVVRVAGRQRQDLGGSLAPGRFTLEERKATPQLLRIHRHPLAAQPDQRSLGLGERGDLLLGERVVADRKVPAELHQLVTAELAGLGDHAVDRGVRRHCEPELDAPVPPGRQEHAEPGFVQLWRCGGQEVIGALGVQVELGRARCTQAGRQLWVDPAGPSEFGQQQFLRAVQPSAQAAVVVPGLLGGDQQAGVLAGLQQELQPPPHRLDVIGRRWLDLGQAKHCPGRADLLGPDVLPRPQRLTQRLDFVWVRVEPAVRDGQRDQPRLGGRQPIRTTTAPRRRELDARRQRRPHGGVDHRLQGRHDQLVCVVLTRFGPAHRRHCGDQRVHGDDVRPPQYGTPIRQRPVLVAADGWHRPSASDEFPGVCRKLGKVGDRSAVADVLDRLVERSKRGRGIHRHDRNRPRQQGRLRTGYRPRRDADQFRGVQRRGTKRRQEHGGRGVLASVRRGKHIRGYGERVRPGRAQCLARALDWSLGILAPDTEAPRRPERVQDQHAVPPSCRASAARYLLAPLGSHTPRRATRRPLRFVVCVATEEAATGPARPPVRSR